MSNKLREEAFLRFKANRMKNKNINQKNNETENKTISEKYSDLRERVKKLEEKIDLVYSTFN